LARHPPLGDRVFGEKPKTRGESLVNVVISALSRALLWSALRRRAAAAIVLPFLALGISAAPAMATTIERVVSPGGIEAWLVRETTVPLITVKFAFTGGAAQDPAGKAGTANLMVSLLDEGAGAYGANAFQDRLDRKAVQLGFSAGRDHIRGTLLTLAENSDEAFDDLRLALTRPRFDAADVELNRAQILSGLRRELKSPTDLAALRWWETAFAGQAYGRPVGGTLESVPHITVNDLRAYQHRVLARNNLTIAIVGDIDADAAKTMLDRVFGALPAQAQLTPIASAMPKDLGQRIDIDLDVPQTVIDFGGEGIARNDPDFFAAYIVNDILGGDSFTSRLYREVRQKRGLVYSIYDSLLWYDDTAVFFGSTATRADRADETVGLIKQEIQQLAENGPTADELAKAKAYLESSFVLGLDTSPKVASLLVQLQLDRLGIDYIDKRQGMIEGVTLADARRVAKRLLGDGLLFTVVGRPTGLASAAGEPGRANGPSALPLPVGGASGASGELR
jgi:zinc protease